ncbi:MAG: XRE family transcriptional regulator [Pseudomonadota bacterium]
MSHEQEVSVRPSLGANLKWLRQKKGWNLNKLAKETGLPQSTLSKVESGQMSLNYEKLFLVAEAMQEEVSTLFQPADLLRERTTPRARRTIQRASEKGFSRDAQYQYQYICTQLKNRLMIPILLRLDGDDGFSGASKGYSDSMTHLVSERFAYVLSGEVVFVSEEYENARLQQGDSLYIDAAMPHAFYAEPGQKADLLAVVTSHDHEYLEFARRAAANNEADASRAYEAYRKERLDL